MTLHTRVFGPEVLKPGAMTRFLEKVEVSGDCWTWVAARTPVGYGRFGIGSSQVYPSHRVSYVWATGEPIPDGLDVDHLCRNTSCVNPLHLEAVDRRTNIARSTAPGAAAAAGVVCRNGHDLTAPNAWAERGGSRGCRLCRNERANASQKTPEARARRNARRRWLRANDPEWAEMDRKRDRERRRRRGQSVS